MDTGGHADESLIQEFDFFRKVRSSYCNVPFFMTFKYNLSYRLEKSATAKGTFNCNVNPHTQTLEYVIQLQSDVIHRPYHERMSILFAHVYDEIPPQVFKFDNYLINKLRYKVPIDYDWQKFVIKGAEAAINRVALQGLLKRWRFRGVNGQLIDANMKVLNVMLIW